MPYVNFVSLMTNVSLVRLRHKWKLTAQGGSHPQRMARRGTRTSLPGGGRPNFTSIDWWQPTALATNVAHSLGQGLLGVAMAAFADG